MRRVQILCDICTRFERYLYPTKQCWIIKWSKTLYCKICIDQIIGLQWYTGEPRCFLSRYEYQLIFECDIAVSQNNKIFLIKNKKLLYQHSEITVLISFMTPYPSTSLFLATGLRRCLVLLRMLPVTYFSRWRQESMRSFNKLSADTFFSSRARSKNTRFVHQNVFPTTGTVLL